MSSKYNSKKLDFLEKSSSSGSLTKTGSDIIKKNSDSNKGASIRALSRQEKISHVISRVGRLFATLESDIFICEDNDYLGFFKTMEDMVEGRYLYHKYLLEKISNKKMIQRIKEMDKCYTKYVNIRDEFENKFPIYKKKLDDHVMRHCYTIFYKDNDENNSFDDIFMKNFDNVGFRTFGESMKKMLDDMNILRNKREAEKFIKNTEEGKRWMAELELETDELSKTKILNRDAMNVYVMFTILVYRAKKQGYNLSEKFFDDMLNNPKKLEEEKNPMWEIFKVFFEQIANPYGLSSIARDSEKLPRILVKVLGMFGNFAARWTANTSLSISTITKIITESMEMRILDQTKKILNKDTEAFDKIFGNLDNDREKLLDISVRYLKKCYRLIWESDYQLIYFILDHFDMYKVASHGLMVLQLPTKEEDITEDHIKAYKKNFLDLAKHGAERLEVLASRLNPYDDCLMKAINSFVKINGHNGT